MTPITHTRTHRPTRRGLVLAALALLAFASVAAAGPGSASGGTGHEAERTGRAKAKKVTALGLGYERSCAVVAGGVRCWGMSSTGSSSFTTANKPKQVQGLSGAKDVSSDDDFACALLKTGKVQCWGTNDHGELGRGNLGGYKPKPAPVKGLTNVKAMSTAVSHGCAVLKNGQVWCWGGDPSYGPTPPGGNQATPVQVAPVILDNKQGVAVDTRGYRTCVLLSNKTVTCWGGSAGSGTGGIDGGVKQVGAGWYATCVLLGTGGVKCWGSNYYGQLGDGSNTDQLTTAVQVKGLTKGVKSISVGNYHACAIVAKDGSVRCWGRNNYGQLGDGSKKDRNKPVKVKGLKKVTAISLGQEHTCAAVKGGGAWCWGRNEFGQLGIGKDTKLSTKPLRVVGLT